MKVLLIEPDYRNKYPPLGLMKISAFHKSQGDYVHFFKGCSKELRAKKWDRIYIATLFTFYWQKTIRTIEFYKTAVKSPDDIYVGGVMASLVGDEIAAETGATVIRGLIDRPGILRPGSRLIVDHLIPDYSILDEIEYKYPVSNAYFGYATRGCPNNCPFCAVPLLEPKFQGYSPLREQVEGIESAYGTQKDLILLDNNVLNSARFKRIIQDIIDLGFEKGAKLDNRGRHVDFNQGIDARRIDEEKIKQLSKIALHPIRFAYDTEGIKQYYAEAVRLASEYGMYRIGTYVLFNYNETPIQFFERLKFGIALNKKYNSQITSFPMKFVPFQQRDRSYVGKHWNKRWLRGVQCILLATHGMVSPRQEFFQAAFGENNHEFRKIVTMPEHYIIWRTKYHQHETVEWEKLFSSLTLSQHSELIQILNEGRVTEERIAQTTGKRLQRILEHYLNEAELAK